MNPTENNKISYINYKPIIATSNDMAGGDLNEIVKKNNESKGWFSSRFCYYPQSIYIKFPYPVHLSQINLCMHEKIIPEKIQFFAYLPDNEGLNVDNYQNLNYNNFGFVKLEDNLKNDFKCREYRKIYVNTNALVVRLDFEKNYYNKFNVYQQVGLISAEFLGSKINGPLNLYKEQFSNNNISNNNNNNLINLYGDLELDQVAKDKIMLFNEKLNIAMKEEKYKECKDIKDKIEQVKLLSLEVSKINKEKLNAVYIEDFDTAQECKLKIQNLRNQIDSIQLNENNNIDTKKENEKEENKEKQNEENEENNHNLNFNQSYENSPLPNKTKPKIQFTEEDYKPYDEIIIPTLRKKKNNNDMNGEFNELNENENNDNNENKDNNEVDKDKLDKYSLLIPFIEKEGVNKLLSNQITVKEIGFGLLKDKLNEMFNSENINDILNLLFDLIINFLEEKNSNTILNTLDLIEKLVTQIQNNYQKINSNKNINYYLQDRYLTIILKKIGDSNPKLSNRAFELLKFFFTQPIYDYNNLLTYLIRRDIKKNEDNTIYHKTSNKIILSKLSIIQYLLELSNPSIKDKLNNSEVETVKQYILMYVSHSKSEIRKLSRLLIQKFINVFGENSILKDLNLIEQRELNKLKQEIPQLKDYIEKLIGKKETNKNVNNSISKISNNNNTSNLNIKSKSPEKKEKKKEKKEKKENCIFCNSNLKGLTLDKHIEKKCPLYTNCPKCRKNIEVKRYTHHCLDECKFKKDFKLCQRCKEAIPVNIYEKHLTENRCNEAKDIKINNRCPLCHEDIPPSDKGFYQHLVIDCCEEQNRKLPKKETGV